MQIGIGEHRGPNIIQLGSRSSVFERVISSGNGYYPTLYIEGNIYLGRSDGVTYVDDTGARAPVLVSTPANLDLGTYELTTRSYESLIK